MMMFLRCVGEAIVAQGMRGLMGLVPFGEQVFDVAANAIERYRHARLEQQLPADVQQAVQADAPRVAHDAKQIAREVAAGRPEAEIIQLEAYLAQIPGVARQSLRRPQDPTGKTVPGTLNLSDPLQLVNLLPRRAPRFKIGDAMPHAQNRCWDDDPDERRRDALAAGGSPGSYQQPAFKGEIVQPAENALQQQDRRHRSPLPNSNRRCRRP